MEGKTARPAEDERLRFAAAEPEDETGPAAIMVAPGASAPVARPRGRASERPGALAASLRGIDRFPLAVATELERGTAFLFLPVFMALGAIGYYALPSEPSLSRLSLLVLAAAGLFHLARQHVALRLSCAALLAVSLGLLAGRIETVRADTKMLGAEISTRLTARVVRIERQASGRVRFTLDVIATERPVLRYAPDRVRVSARSMPPGVAAGDVVAGVVRLMPPPGPVRPGGYDFAFESYFDGIGAIGFFMIGPERVPSAAPAAPSAGLGAWVQGLRERIAAHVAETVGGAEGQIAAALIAGVRAGIPEEVNEHLRRTGLAHILSISGLHMALVAGSVMGALRVGFALFPGFASRRPAKKYAAALALLAVGFYLFVSGAAVAAQRSFIMIAVMLVAVLFDRAALTMRNLAIAALIVLALSPHEVVGPSFQMSFAATAALIAAYSAWSRRRTLRVTAHVPSRSVMLGGLRKVALYGFGLAATSVIAGLATGLYGAWHFHRVAPLGLAANLAAMPFVSVLVMPFAVLAAVTTPLGLDALPLWVMGKGIAIVLTVAAWLAERSPFDTVGAIRIEALLVLTVALVLLTMLTTWLRALAIPFLLIGMAMLAFPPRPDVQVAEDARLTGLDAGAGLLAVNRGRPNAFTVENWLRAGGFTDVIKPVGPEDSDKAPDSSAFVCQAQACVATDADGWKVVHAETSAAAGPHCADARLIVIEDASAEDVCGNTGPFVLTARDLARRGAAGIAFGPEGRVAIQQAIAWPYRPWHDHRRYSREARGMPPYERRKPGKQAGEQAAPEAESSPADQADDAEISTGE